MDSLMHPNRIRMLRAMYADWLEGVQVIPEDDTEGQESLRVIGLALLEVVPELLDGVEQLQAEREEGGRPRIRDYVRFDPKGGSA